MNQVATLGGHMLGQRRNIEFALGFAEASKEFRRRLLVQGVASHSLIGLCSDLSLIQRAQQVPAHAPGEGTAVIRHLAD